MKVQLWLENEETFIDIRLAEVRRVHEHWIAVEVIQVSSNDRMRLKRYFDPSGATDKDEQILLDHLLIRA